VSGRYCTVGGDNDGAVTLLVMQWDI